MSSGRIEPKSPPKILVVDSIRVIREWARDTLSDAGYRVTPISRLDQIEAHLGDDVTAILLADRMPEGDVSRAILRWQAPDSCWRGPVLVLVSDPRAFTAGKACRLRIADCLFMPLNPAELTWRMALAIRRQDAALATGPTASRSPAPASPARSPRPTPQPSPPTQTSLSTQPPLSASTTAPESTSFPPPTSSPKSPLSTPMAEISRLRLLREFEEPLASTRALTEQMASRWLTADALASLAVLRGFLEATRRLIAGVNDSDSDPASGPPRSTGQDPRTAMDAGAADAIRPDRSPAAIGSDQIVRLEPTGRPVPEPHRPTISRPLTPMSLPDPNG